MDLAPLDTRLGEMDRRVAILEGRRPPVPPDLAPLNQQIGRLAYRIERLEARPAPRAQPARRPSAPADLRAIDQRLARLAYRLEAVENAKGPLSVDFDDLRRQIDRLAARIQALEKR